MAARTVHCFLNNLTDETLTLDNENLEWGEYTEPWFVPGTIAPKSVGQWRTESDGFMTGTEGRARFSISSGEGTEFIDVWWDNPFIGGNKSSIGIVEDFTGKPSKVFEGANKIDGSPPPNLVKMEQGDVEAWIDAILFPPYIIANAPVANDANAVFAIRPKAQQESTPLFGPQGTTHRSSRVNTSRNPEEWEGLWTSAATSVSLTSLVQRKMSATVTDTTATPSLQFKEAFTLGAPNWALSAFALEVHKEFARVEPAIVPAIIKATDTVSRLYNPEEPGHLASIQEDVFTELSNSKFKVSSDKLKKFSKAAITVAKLPHSTVMLSNGVGLTLYDVLEGGQVVDRQLLYERSTYGIVLAREWLDFVIPLH